MSEGRAGTHEFNQIPAQKLILHPHNHSLGSHTNVGQSIYHLFRLLFTHPKLTTYKS
ncbi:hypothetical protein HanIR_Chr15g0766631 [Helianthus annuus]|nr:hypothetical protein HanIR_Chr15g0766631 [Helianthus annuus]